MNRIRGLFSSFDRLSSREKGLIVGMVALFGGVIVFFVVLAVSSALSSLEEEVQTGRDALKSIHKRADDYREVARKQKAIQALIDDNPINSLRIPVNTIAKGVTARSEQEDYAGQGKKLSELVSYGGKTTETRIESKSRKKRRRSRKEKDAGGNFEIEQSMEFTDIPLTSLYEFLEELRKSEGLLFVRRLEITRRFNNLEHARASLSVSTIKFREAEEGL